MRTSLFCFIVLVTVATGCAQKGIRTAAPEQQGFQHVQERGAVLVGVKPCWNAADCEGVSSTDATKLGLLPVNLFIDNTGESEYIFSKSYTEIVISNEHRVAPLYFDQILELAQEASKRKKKYLWGRLFPGGDPGLAMAGNIRKSELHSTVILAKQRYTGFLFFPLAEQEDLYRGGKLRIMLRGLKPGEVLHFELLL